MIRVNLLHNRKDGMQKLPAEPGGASFISGREVLLAAVFLVLGGVILWFVVSESSSPEAEAFVAEKSAPAEEVASADPAMATSGSGQGAASGAQPAASTAPLAGETPGATPPPTPSAALQPGAAQNSTPSTVSPAPSGAAPESRTPAPRTSQPIPAQPRSAAVDRPATSSGAAASSAGSVTLNEVRVLNETGGLQILAATDRRPEYKLFRVENPDRVVIDMPGAWLEVPRAGREVQVSHPIVKLLRVAQNQLEPPLVRLVLEVASFPDLQVVPRADGLLISIE